MRSNINNSSIANVITRFVKATSMLRAEFAPQRHWHLEPCAGSLSSGNSGTNLLFRDMTPVMSGPTGSGIGGSYVLQPYFQMSLEQPGNVVSSIRQLFQRLS